jgi:hypothetical protein
MQTMPLPAIHHPPSIMMNQKHSALIRNSASPGGSTHGELEENGMENKGFQIEQSDMSSIGTFHAQGLHSTMPARSGGVNMKNFERQKFGGGNEKVQKLQQKSSILANKLAPPLLNQNQAEKGKLELKVQSKIINSIEEKSQTKEEGGTGSPIVSAILSPIGSSRMDHAGSVF